MLASLFHLLVGLLGLSLLYTALFLHGTEEGQLQNRLEKLWVDVDDLSKAALSRQTAFLQQISAMANSTLNSLFGIRLFSAGAVSASISFSVGTMLLFCAYIGMAGWGFYGLALAFLALGLISFLVGLSPLPFRYLGLLWIPGLLLLSPPNEMVGGWKSWMTENFFSGGALLAVSFLSSVLFIAMSCWCFRKSSELNNGWKVASLVFLNGCIGILGLICPIVLSGKLPKSNDFDVGALEVFGFPNLVTGVIASLFVLLALAAIAHLAAWPILKRPIYSLQRFGVARQPKLLAAVAGTCLLFAWPHSPIIQGISQLIHGR